MTRTRTRTRLLKVALFTVALTWSGWSITTSGQSSDDERTVKGQPIADLLSSGGRAALLGGDVAPSADVAPLFTPLVSPDGLAGSAQDVSASSDDDDNPGGRNKFVNDPCLDPPPTLADADPERRRRTVQSETEIAVLNSAFDDDDDDDDSDSGKKMVVGYNDSFGFYNNRQGLSGFSYSTNGGSKWIDGGGLPPRVPTGLPARTGSDGYFGDPVVVVHHQTETFYFTSIYKRPDDGFTISVNRGRFMEAPPQGVESKANTRCKGKPAEHGIPDPPGNEERIIWDLPAEAAAPVFGPAPGSVDDDFLDKEWIYVDQRTGTLYITYTRFAGDGATPIEMVRCIGCAFKPGPLTSADFTPPSVIVANEDFDFNQATTPITTTKPGVPGGPNRVIVTWIMRRFGTAPSFPETENRIEYAFSDNDGVTWSPEQTVAVVNPQREPRGYNRVRRTILNAPYVTVDKGADDGVDTARETARPGFGNTYITYFDGKTALPGLLPATTRAADIILSTSTNNGTSFGPKKKVNNDTPNTTHVFPSVQANRKGLVFLSWIDRRLDPANNLLNDTWATVSRDGGQTFLRNVRQTDISTSWHTRIDARPNMGDYNSSELVRFQKFVQVWADGRFPGPVNATCSRFSNEPCPAGTPEPTTTPDSIFSKQRGLPQ